MILTAALILLGGVAISPLLIISPSPYPPHRVILIPVDTLRVDRLGCYGYDKNTTLSIDGLARESVLFRNAITPRPKTAP